MVYSHLLDDCKYKQASKEYSVEHRVLVVYPCPLLLDLRL